MAEVKQEDRTYGVYVITNIRNDKKYIGKGKVLPDKTCRRWDSHANVSGKSAISEAIKKYGADGFTYNWLVEGLSAEEAYAEEIVQIALHKTNIHEHGKLYGYNLDAGGKGSRGAKRTAAQKAHLSSILKGRPSPKSPTAIARAAARRKPQRDVRAALRAICVFLRRCVKRTQSEETREKRRLSMLGKNTGVKSSDHREKISATMKERGSVAGERNPMYGRSLNLTPEAEALRRERIAATATGKKRGPYKCSKCGTIGHNRERCRAT